MSKTNKNLYYTVLKSISDQGCSSFKYLAKLLDVTNELLELVLQSLIEKGFLKFIDEREYYKEFEKSFACKFCPFAKECSKKIPYFFYELTPKGKEMIN